MSGLLFIGLVVAVIALLSRLSETKTQLREAERERDAYKTVLTAVRANQRDKDVEE